MERYNLTDQARRILIVHPWALVRYGVKHVLESKNDPTPLFKVAAASDASEALRRLSEGSFDIVLLAEDIQIGGTPMFVREILKPLPDLRILIMGDKPKLEDIKEVIKSGAIGYIHMNIATSELFEAVINTYSGRTYYSAKVANQLLAESEVAYEIARRAPTSLSPRELEVLRLIVRGKTSKEIADRLLIGLRTVETHRKSLFRKAKVKNVTSLVRMAHEYNLVE